jgi:beta-1,4-mannosyl-glycoprotein beta-1,4-N-acetylglucosaminyltransferase
MTVVDSTLFSEDFTALDIRINELNPVVDLFLICESNFSFSGKPKDFYLSKNLSRYSKFLHKIRVIRYELEDPHPNAWVQESKQRQFLSSQIRSLGLLPSDLIISSDCDEIPKATVIFNLINKPTNHLLVLRNFTGYLNVECGVYRRCRVSSAREFTSVEKMRRDIYVYDNWDNRRLVFPVMKIPQWFTCRGGGGLFPELTYRKPKLNVIEDAGWHFNHLMRGESMRRKIMFSSHTALAQGVDTLAINDAMAKAEDVYKRQITKIVDIDDSFPVYVQEHKSLLQEYIYSKKPTN